MLGGDQVRGGGTVGRAGRRDRPTGNQGHPQAQPGPTATAFLDNLDFAATEEDYDQTVREVLKSISALPPQAFSSPARIAAAIRGAVSSTEPPLRLALGTSGAADMRAALVARLSDLDSRAAVTAAVDA